MLLLLLLLLVLVLVLVLLALLLLLLVLLLAVPLSFSRCRVVARHGQPRRDHRRLGPVPPEPRQVEPGGAEGGG